MHSPTFSPQPMVLRVGYDIQFQIPAPVAIVALLNVHPSRVANLLATDELCAAPAVQMESYIDGFGNYSRALRRTEGRAPPQ